MYNKETLSLMSLPDLYKAREYIQYRRLSLGAQIEMPHLAFIERDTLKSEAKRLNDLFNQVNNLISTHELLEND